MTRIALQNVSFRQRTGPARAALAALIVLTAALCRPAAAAEGPGKDDDRLGMSIHVPLPITTETATRVELFVDRALRKAKREKKSRPVLIFQFDFPEDQEVNAASTDYHDAAKLAYLVSGKKLNKAQTVAFIPKTLSGHAVLVALACDEIIMAPEAQLGPVDPEHKEIADAQRTAYKEIARRRRRIDPALALWLLDPSLEILRVKTQTRAFVTPEELEELEKNQTIDPNSVKPLTELVESLPGQLTGDEARRLDVASYLADDSEQVARVLGLPPRAMQEDPSLTGAWTAMRVELIGPISEGSVQKIKNSIKREVGRRGVNFVCLWIDSAGGSATASIDLIGFLHTSYKDVLTVGYIPRGGRATSDAALVAAACDHLVMHPDAELGGSAGEPLGDNVRSITGAIRRDEHFDRFGSWSLVAALLDEDLEVFHCKGPSGQIRYFCEEELGEQPDPTKWHKGRQITKPGEPLRVSGEQAFEYGLAYATAEDLSEFKRLFGLENDPQLVEPGWAQFLVDALAMPGVAAMLLTIAFMALYFELHAPGVGIGGFVATVCFLLFFWGHSLGGTAGWLEVTLFVAGVGCLLLEVFVLPGFGIFGLGGGCLVLLSLVLASQTFILPQNDYQFVQLKRSLTMIAMSGVLIVTGALLLRRFLPKAPFFNHMILNPPQGEEARDIGRNELLLDLGDFVGKRGTTTTQLTPGGKARFGDELIDVITDGDVLPAETEIKVVEVYGNRVVVEPVVRRG